MSNEETGLYSKIKPEDLDIIRLEIEVWKKTIEVQQHFNDIEMRIRNMAVTVLGGLLAATALAINANRIGTAILLLIAGLVIWLAFYFMDQYWYHQLLRGSVKNAHNIENRLKDKIPGLNLSNTISCASKVEFFKKNTDSTWRLKFFYRAVASLLVTFIVILGLVIYTSPYTNLTTLITPTPTTSVSATSSLATPSIRPTTTVVQPDPTIMLTAIPTPNLPTPTELSLPSPTTRP